MGAREIPGLGIGVLGSAGLPGGGTAPRGCLVSLVFLCQLQAYSSHGTAINLTGVFVLVPREYSYIAQEQCFWQ